MAALAYVATNHGRMPLGRALEVAARVAEDGFVPDRGYRGRWKETLREIAFAGPTDPVYAEFRRIWTVPAEELGWVLRQPELARSYREWARTGVEGFYRGEFAKKASEFLRAQGGVMREEDFRAYQPRLRQAVRTTYRGYEIVGFPPPSSGGVHMGQILNILERFDLRGMGEGSAEWVHVVAEAMKCAFADRARWLGDPDFARVPRGLMSKEYAAGLAAGMDLGRVRTLAGAGQPPGAEVDVFESERHRHTTHFSVADAEGNWVGCTATVNTSFGSKVVVPGTGLVLNNEMDDFAAAPGVANHFGLVGAEANAVAGGKRPLSSMSPTLVLKDGRPVLVVGAAGGPTIISQTVLAIVRVVDFGRSAGEALAAPRFHHQWRPDELRLERAWSEGMADKLRAKGHRVVWVDALGATQAVGLGSGGGFDAVSDPRVEGLGGTR
jgi:gamma-glutamyltranspeptidase/glutathione hydrolase